MLFVIPSFPAAAFCGESGNPSARNVDFEPIKVDFDAQTRVKDGSPNCASKLACG